MPRSREAINWRLRRGGHSAPTSRGDTNIVELAVVMSPLPYRPVRCTFDLPGWFCPTLSMFLLTLNDALPDVERQRLLPLAPALIGSRDHDGRVERGRALRLLSFAPALDDAERAAAARFISPHEGGSSAATMLCRAVVRARAKKRAAALNRALEAFGRGGRAWQGAI